MSRQDRILKALNAALAPRAIDVLDESEQHHGHAGWREGGETHYRVRVISDAFAGRTRIQRHRLVMDVLSGEFETGLHALAIDAKAPGER